MAKILATCMYSYPLTYMHKHIYIPLKLAFAGVYLTYHPSHRHERTVTGNDMLEAIQIRRLNCLLN